MAYRTAQAAAVSVLLCAVALPVTRSLASGLGQGLHRRRLPRRLSLSLGASAPRRLRRRRHRLHGPAAARLGFRRNQRFSAGIETDYVFVIGLDDYNSTVNRETRYPIVADPDGFDLNQLFLRYGTENLHATVGRQRINHGSQRNRRRRCLASERADIRRLPPAARGKAELGLRLRLASEPHLRPRRRHSAAHMGTATRTSSAPRSTR